MKKSWDIFCKIVDNFGDIGVCWRLARQLHVEHDLQIRLWIDDLEAAQKIIPNVNVDENSQVCEEITILKWHESVDFSQAAEVVIEAFACGLPATYLTAMAQKKSAGVESKWVNLEYLSAESWVADFHAKPSPQPNGLTRYFYFPGFTEATGGLIREADIYARHSDESRNPAALKSLDSDFRRNDKVGLLRELRAETQNYPDTSFPRKRESILNKNSRWIPAFAGMTDGGVSKYDLKISLFCYPHAPIHALFDAFAASSQVINCYVPASSILPQIADYFGVETIDVGDYLSRENLHVHILPFLSQADYDALLRDCDINFVRGEDSWVRAIWAGKPFIWQPYFQDENTHVKKLNAFLDLFYEGINTQTLTQSSFPPPIQSLEGRLLRESSLATKNKMDSRLRGNDKTREDVEFNSVANVHNTWLAGHITTEVWQNYLANLTAIKNHTQMKAAQLAQQSDLASKLVIFCNKIP